MDRGGGVRQDRECAVSVCCFFFQLLDFWHQTTVKVEIGRQFFPRHLLFLRRSRILAIRFASSPVFHFPSRGGSAQNVPIYCDIYEHK